MVARLIVALLAVARGIVARLIVALLIFTLIALAGAALLIAADRIALGALIVIAVEIVAAAALRALRGGRHVAVFLVQLARVAARTAVDPVAAVTLPLAASALRTLPATTTAATAAGRTIVDQITVLVLNPSSAFCSGYSVQPSPARDGRRYAARSEPATAAGLQRLMTKGGQPAQIQHLALDLRAPAADIAGAQGFSKRNVVAASFGFKA